MTLLCIIICTYLFLHFVYLLYCLCSFVNPSKDREIIEVHVYKKWPLLNEAPLYIETSNARYSLWSRSQTNLISWIRALCVHVYRQKYENCNIFKHYIHFLKYHIEYLVMVYTQDKAIFLLWSVRRIPKWKLTCCKFSHVVWSLL